MRGIPLTYWSLIQLATLLLSAQTSLAGTLGSATEMRVKADLEESLSHLMTKDNFIVQATATVDTVTERQVVEGETITQQNVNLSVNVPPLPGFQPSPLQAQPQPPSQNRQVYKMV